MIERIFAKHYSYYDQSRQDYYERSVFPVEITVFLEHLKCPDWHPSALNIDFKDLNWGQAKSELLELSGRPRYTHNTVIGDQTHTVVFYRERIIKDHFLVQYHFFNDIFFFGCYTFKEWNPKRRDGFKNVVVKKYAPEISDVSRNPIRISDSSNNKIIIIDSVNLHIGYLSGDKKVHEALQAAVTWQLDNAALDKSNKVIKLYSSF